MAARKLNIGDLPLERVQLESIILKAPEDPEDKSARLHREYWTFLVEKLAAYAFSFLFLFVIGVYCCYVIARHGPVSPEARAVLPLLTTLFGGVLGVIVGKAAK